MMVARFYSNENFPFPVVELLRQLGHDVVTILERGRAGEGMPDREVLKLATDEGRAVLTLNRKDFIRLHRADSDHAGIVVCTADADFPVLANRIHESIARIGELPGQIVRIQRPQG